MTNMWILQIRSDDDGLDLIYTCNSEFISDELKARYFDVWTMGGISSVFIEWSRCYTLTRDSDSVVMAQLWKEY